jgi:hypothetical protein
MSTQKDLLRMVKSVLQHRRGARDVEMMYPAREWGIGLIGGILMLVIGGFLSYQAYERIQATSNAVPAVVTPAVPYEAATIEKAIHFFSDKQKQYEALKGGTRVPEDTPVFPLATSTTEVVSNVDTLATTTPVTEAATTDSTQPAVAPTTTPAAAPVSPEPSSLF